MLTEKRRSFIIRVVYYLILAGIAYALLKYAIPMLMPFVLGFVIAYLLQRPVRFLRSRIKHSGKLIAILVVAAFYATVGALIALLVVQVYAGIDALIQKIPQFYSVHVTPVLTDMFSRVEQFMLQLGGHAFDIVALWDAQLLSSLGNMVSEFSAKAVAEVPGLAATLPGLFIKLVLMIISTFFIAADYDSLTGFCMHQLSEKSKLIFLEIKQYVIGTLFVCIRSYLLIMSVTFVELTVGLSIIGIDHAVLIAAMIAVFDVLPVLGTGGIMIPWIVISAVSGRVSLALSLLVLYIAITVIRNIIEPKIVGKQLGLHSVVTLASMFVGAQVLGVVGLFGFPIGLSLLQYLNNDGVINIFKKPESADQ